MIRIVLLGRTGNNLFQYALGRVLSEKHGVPLVMDASWFNQKGWREVSHFLSLPLRAKVVRRFSIGSRALRNLVGKHHWEYLGISHLRESTFDQSFDARFLDAPANCMLFGYFQSPLYFQGIAHALRIELNTLLINAVKPAEPIRHLLDSPTSVAVHVRRRDYLDHPALQVCDRNYYKKSIQQMRERLTASRYFIFSDDPEWCRAEFQDEDHTVVDSGVAAENPLHDLYLMSLASHHIIANSTYSWWAAWLGEKTGQQVIMPARWHAGGAIVPIDEKRLAHWTTA
jgi:hypothetical protein